MGYIKARYLSEGFQKTFVCLFETNSYAVITYRADVRKLDA